MVSLDQFYSIHSFIQPVRHPFMHMWTVNQNIACYICKQRMLQPSSHHITASGQWALRETQDGNKRAAHCQAHLAVSHCSHPSQCTLRKLKMIKHRILAPGSWGAYQRNDFSVARLMHLSIHRKALNSLTWEIWFNFINSNLLMFQPSGFVAKSPIYPGSPHFLFRTVSHHYLRCCVPGLTSQICPLNKT